MLIRFRADITAGMTFKSINCISVQRKGIHAVFPQRTEQSRIDFHQVLNSTRSLTNKAIFTDSVTFRPRTKKHQYLIWSLQVKFFRFESYCDNKHQSTHHHQCVPEHSSSSSTTFRFSMNVFMQRFLNKRFLNKSP